MFRKSIFFSLVMVGCSFTPVLGSGYRIPEQSLNSTALSSAYVAHASGPDSAYFNPANLAWEETGGWQVEGGMSLIFLPSIKYRDHRSSTFNGGTEEESFLIPTFFAVSPEFNKFRFGFAMVSPAGLSKKWHDPYQMTFAQESSMTVLEANPSVAYRFNDRLSVGIGARILYSEATIKSFGTIVAVPAGGLGGGLPLSDEYVTISRNMEGDTVEVGYNMALTFRPTAALTLAVTYRSEIDLGMEGDGTLTASDSFPNFLMPEQIYQGPGSVAIPVPAVLVLAAAYTFDRATVEFAFDRTFWSTYDALVFHYPADLGHPVLTQAFDTPISKNWDDVNAYRLGLTYRWNENLTLMAGAGIDGNPIPDSTISFDLPDSDAWYASLGFRYSYNEKLTYGAAYLYADKEDRSAVDGSAIVDGTFSGAATHLLALALTYLF